MSREVIGLIALVLVVGGSVMVGWLLNEWQRRPRYRRHRHR